MSLFEVLDDLCKWEAMGKDHPEFNPDDEVPTPESIATVRKLIALKVILIDKPTFYGACGTWEIPGGYHIEQHDRDGIIKIFRVNSFGNAHLSIFSASERILTVRYE